MDEVLWGDVALLLYFVTLLPWLWATARLTGHSPRWFRIGVASLLGSGANVLWQWFALGRNLPLALLGTLVLMRLAFGPVRIFPLLRSVCVFVLIGAIAAGLSLLVTAQTGWESPSVLIGVALMAGGAQMIWTEMVTKANLVANRWQVRLKMGERTLCLTGLLDTGHQLRAPVTGLPVLLVAPSDLAPLLGQPLTERLVGGLSEWDRLPGPWQGRVSPIPYQTVAGEGLLPAFRPDGLWLQRPGGAWQQVKALIGVTAFGVGGRGDYQVLLPPLLTDSLPDCMGGRA